MPARAPTDRRVWVSACVPERVSVSAPVEARKRESWGGGEDGGRKDELGGSRWAKRRALARNASGVSRERIRVCVSGGGCCHDR
eukprot:2378817-Pleurochrysis_carterae.AAC.2